MLQFDHTIFFDRVMLDDLRRSGLGWGAIEFENRHCEACLYRG